MNEENKYKFLFKINSPADIRNFQTPELKTLCQEIRDYLIDVVSKVGGGISEGALEPLSSRWRYIRFLTRLMT